MSFSGWLSVDLLKSHPGEREADEAEDDWLEEGRRALYCERRRDWTALNGDENGGLEGGEDEGAFQERGEEFCGLCDVRWGVLY